MYQYLNLLKKILETGIDSENRTGVPARSIFGEQLRFNLNAGFPAVTTKKLAWNSVVSELLWFIEGSRDERRLAEIQYGTRDENKTTIWTANAQANYWKDKAEFIGDVGKIYGYQWRHWERPAIFHKSGGPLTADSSSWIPTPGVNSFWEFPPAIDQLKNLIDGLKNDPNGRRHIITAWNVGELDQMALPPCHMIAQFYIKNNKLSCMMSQRSCDSFLGIPYNIASYALFTHLIAKTIGSGVQDLIINFGDTHIYANHFDAVITQLLRIPFDLPTLQINKDVDIWTAKVSDCKLLNYQCHPIIKAEMAV